MRRLLVMLVAIVSGYSAMWAQSLTDMDAIMLFLGSDDPLELEPEEVEQLEHLLADPLRLNSASESVIRSSGLFSAYQIAVISDYRLHHGPIRSLMELSMLDGFGSDYSAKIAPFIDLESAENSGHASGNGVKHDFASKGSFIWREDEGCDGSYGIKLRVNSPGNFSASLATSGASGSASWVPSAYSGSFAWQFKRLPLRLVAGDFYARFGQGLVLWSSSFMNSLTGPDSFMKRPSGITQPWAFTGGTSMTGIAADYGRRQWKVSLIADIPDMKTGMNVAWYGRNGQISSTTVAKMQRIGTNAEMEVVSGLDAAFCVRGVNLFGEFAYVWDTRIPSILAGSRFRLGEPLDMAVQIRAVQNDEFGAALSGAFRLGQKRPSCGTLSVESVYYPVSKEDGETYSLQIKSLLQWEIVLSENWKVKIRLSERLRTWGLPFRTDVRSDMIYSSQAFVVSMRVNLLSSDNTGFLSYLEGGYNGDKLSLYLRQGVFFIDDWDDRIYVYERDAPSSFNVPAMYGRGVWTAMTASWRASTFLKLYARASFTGYPFMIKKKPGKAELKLQLQYRF